MTDLAPLLARLQEADGKHSDPAIVLALCDAFGKAVCGFKPSVREFIFALGGEPDASLDAAVALAQAVEPAVEIALHIGAVDAYARLRLGNEHGDGVTSRTPPLALCTALVEWRMRAALDAARETGQ